MKLKLFSILCCILFSGCATVMSSSEQSISVKVIDSKNSEILENTSCIFTNSNGDSYTMYGGNPGFVKVPRGKGSLTVVCKKPGYKQLNYQVGDSFNKTTLVNLIFWPGMLVDLATGAYQKYPSHYVITMESIK